jgi:hypothetical protein
MEILIKGQEFLVYLIFIMFVTGILKERGYLMDIFRLLEQKVKSKRMVVFLVSLFGGILPIPGRVALSASMLNSIAPVDNKKRKKFGIIDYLATHHYYLWSPLEKTVIIPMAVLSLTYMQFMSYIWPLLLISALYITYYILSLKDDEIDIEVKDEPINMQNITMVVIPFLVTILMCVFFTEYYFGFFTGFTIWLVYYSKSWSKIIGYIDWELIWIVALVIILGNLVGSYYTQIEAIIKQYNTPSNILIVSVLGFLASFLLGSSAKYAGIVSLLTSVFGMHYFVLFFTLEYSAYLISPSHKCLPIGQRYFHTGFLTYLKALIIWISMMITYAIFTVL